MKRYEAFLAGRGVSKAAFEEDARRQLTRQKMEGLVKTGIKVSDGELQQAYASRRDGVRAAWAVVDQGPLAAAITPTDEELTKYLADHAAEFRLPERRRIDLAIADHRTVERDRARHSRRAARALLLVARFSLLAGRCSARPSMSP